MFVPVPSFELFLDTICSNVQQSAADRPRVMIALLRLLENVATSSTSSTRRKAVLNQIDLIEADAQKAIDQPSDLDPILVMADAASFAAETGTVRHA